MLLFSNSSQLKQKLKTQLSALLLIISGGAFLALLPLLPANETIRDGLVNPIVMISLLALHIQLAKIFFSSRAQLRAEKSVL